MPNVLALGVLALLIAQTIDTAACDENAAPPPSTDVLTTQDGIRFRVETVVTNLEIPWSMAFAPDGRLFLTERPGRVRILDLEARTSELALTLDDVYRESEAGLLGLALDPLFTQNRFVYLYYSAIDNGTPFNRIVRYREVGARLGERAVLLDRLPAGSIHDGGRLRFGPDGLLYATLGDAGNGAFSQSVGTLAGKILRLNRDGTTPAGNPFSSPVYSYGHRNPQGLDWHPTNGDLWAAEHGQTGNDEVNVIDAGANYGWPIIEAAAARPDMRTPVAFYSPAVAPSGVSFYRGQQFPGFAGNLFVATLRGTHLLRLRLDGASRRIAAQERLLEGTFGRIRDVIPGPDGFLYFATNNRDGRGSPIATDDRIARLVPAP